MRKRPSETPPTVYSVVANGRPDGSTKFRLRDAEGRFFPPLDQPAYYAFPRVDRPSAPDGGYGIQFEDDQGNVIAPEDGQMPEIILSSSQEPLIALPDDIETHRERKWQQVEKRAYKLQREAMKNEALGQVLSMLVESQRQSTELIQTFSKGQKELLEQQNELIKATRNIQPPHQED